MAGRGPQTFKKRQKEQQRKEKQEEKRARRFQRARGESPDPDAPVDPEASPNEGDVVEEPSEVDPFAG